MKRRAMKFEVRYWLESGAQYASWLITDDWSEAESVARDLRMRRQRNRIEVVEVAA